jgi:hypothetical protein
MPVLDLPQENAADADPESGSKPHEQETSVDEGSWAKVKLAGFSPMAAAKSQTWAKVKQAHVTSGKRIVQNTDLHDLLLQEGLVSATLGSLRTEIMEKLELSPGIGGPNAVALGFTGLKNELDQTAVQRAETAEQEVARLTLVQAIQRAEAAENKVETLRQNEVELERATLRAERAEAEVKRLSGGLMEMSREVPVGLLRRRMTNPRMMK